MKNLVKVLLVDDDPGMRGLLRRMVARPFVAVVEAATAAQARAAVRTARFDLLICDVRLPDGDGLDLVETFVKDQPGLRALVLTGEPTADGKRRAERAGAGFLAKSMNPAEITSALAALLVEEER